MRYISIVLIMAAVGCAATNTIPDFFKTELTIDSWRTVEDVVEGWDWSLPPSAKPAAGSAISVTEQLVDDRFPGRLMRKVNTSWRKIEPAEGEYDFQSLREKILEQSENGKYALELHVRASVWNMLMFPDEADYPATWLDHIKETRTAPRWLAEYDIPLIEEKKMGLKRIGTPFQIVNMDITHPDYHSRYLKMVRALGQSGILKIPEVSFIFVHYRSGSRGEEGQSSNDPEEKKVYLERLQAWADAAGERRGSLVAVSHKPEDIQAATDLGMGQRNGFVEMYLLHCNNTGLGQSIDDEGYLVVDEENPIIKEGRAFGDENEEYVLGTHEARFGPVEFWPHRYRESMLRALQMRRNFLWAENGSVLIDPPLLAFTALQLGHTVETAPDAWCRLRESYVKKEYGKSRVVPVKNFERWLFQRDRKGYETVPVKKVMHARDFASYGALGREYAKGYNYDFSARSGRKIGFAVNDRFLSGGPHRVALKITFYDESKHPFYLNYQTPAGAAKKRIEGVGDRQLKTATLFLDDAVFKGVGYEGYDFVIGDGRDEVTLAFVRVIKQDP